MVALRIPMRVWLHTWVRGSNLPRVWQSRGDTFKSDVTQLAKTWISNSGITGVEAWKRGCVDTRKRGCVEATARLAVCDVRFLQVKLRSLKIPCPRGGHAEPIAGVTNIAWYYTLQQKLCTPELNRKVIADCKTGCNNESPGYKGVTWHKLLPIKSGSMVALRIPMRVWLHTWVRGSNLPRVCVLYAPHICFCGRSLEPLCQKNVL